MNPSNRFDHMFALNFYFVKFVRFKVSLLLSLFPGKATTQVWCGGNLADKFVNKSVLITTAKE